MRPQPGYYDSLVQEAAALVEGLANNHFFVDGNKRVAFFVTGTFPRLNGHFIDCLAKEMGLTDLGTLDSVDLRQVWQNEASDFSPWLAKNLDSLGEALGMEIDTEDVDTEVSVGKYSADILCRDSSDSSRIVIENQFGGTDHNHLGKLLTYASALDSDPPVRSVIWISESFNDEHRSTLDWLNRISHDELRFFGVTIELLRIEGSKPAPRFNIAASPNDWTTVVRASSGGRVSDLDRQYQQFWTALIERLPSSAPRLKPRTPLLRPYYSLAIGKAGFALNCRLSQQKKQLHVALEIKGKNPDYHFNLLKQQKSAIEEKVGDPLNWQGKTKGRAYKISLIKSGNPTDESDRANQIEWMAQTLNKFDKAFRDLVQNLTTED